MKQRVLKVHPADNVLVALQELRKGETVQWQGRRHVTAEDIGAKHKFFESEAGRADGLHSGRLPQRRSR